MPVPLDLFAKTWTSSRGHCLGELKNELTVLAPISVMPAVVGGHPGAGTSGLDSRFHGNDRRSY